MRLQIVILGSVPKDVSQAVKRLKFDIVQFCPRVETFAFRGGADIEGWGYSDQIINQSVRNFDADLTLILTNVPLELNWYARRLGNARAVMTYFEMAEILQAEKIPLGNLIHRVVYAYYLMFVQNGNALPDYHERSDLVHTDTRGCIFDMTGLKNEIVHSCVSPILCDDCATNMRRSGVSIESIADVRAALRRVNRGVYKSLHHQLARRPVVTFLIGSLFGALISAFTTFLVG